MADIRWELHPITLFSQLANTWDSINAQGSALPFLESGFIAPLYEHLGNGTEQIAIAHHGTKIVAACIIERTGRCSWTSAQCSQLPLGPCVAVRDQNLNQLILSLFSRLPGITLNIGLTELDPFFFPRPDNTDNRIQTMDYIQTAWIEVDRSFDAYWEERGKNLRTNMRKQRTKLETDGIALKLETLTSPEDIPAAIAEYGRLESASWKADNGTAVHPDNAQGRFYTAMMQHFCRIGRGHIWVLKFDDKVVAMDLCIEANDTLVVLKTTFDAEYRTISPAFLMRQDAFRQIFDEGRIRRIEFYGKVMEWHTRWTENARTIYHLNVYRWGFVPQLKKVINRAPSTPQESTTVNTG